MMRRLEGAVAVATLITAVRFFVNGRCGGGDVL